MSDNSITEKTTINLSISSWWHVLIIVGVIVSCYFGLEAKADQAVKLSEDTARKQEVLSEKLQNLNMNIQSITDNVKYFREAYERDMSKYIRDPGKH